MTFLEEDELVVGKNLSEWSVFWQTLAVPAQTGWERFGDLDGCSLVELLGA